MKRIDIEHNIEGSRLKKQFLEAFLLQSTYIEGLLKKIIEDEFSNNVSLPLLMAEFNKDNSKIPQPNKLIQSIEKKLLRQNLSEIINQLKDTKVIDDQSLINKLHKYREDRNNILHSLVTSISEDDFDRDIEKLVDLGKEILETEIMIKGAESVQRKEDFTEVIKSGDQEKINKFIKGEK